MGVLCTKCRTYVDPGDEYVVYGGFNWCDLECLAKYYVEHEDMINSLCDLDKWRDPIEKFEQKYEVKVA